MAAPSTTVLHPLSSGVTYTGAVPLVSAPVGVRTVQYPVAPAAVAPNPFVAPAVVAPHHFVAPTVSYVRDSETEVNQDQAAAPLPLIFNPVVGPTVAGPTVYTPVAVGDNLAAYNLLGVTVQAVPSSGTIPDNCDVVTILGKQLFMICKD